MRVHALVIGATAALAIGAAATGPATSPQVQLTVFGVPMPLEPAGSLPSAEQLVSLMSGIADPHAPATSKSGLVEGGLGPIERTVMDGRMRKGLDNGKLPLTLSASNIQADGPGAATADITASSPKLDPRSVNLKFVDQDGWKLSHASLMTLSQMTSS